MDDKIMQEQENSEDVVDSKEKTTDNRSRTDDRPEPADNETVALQDQLNELKDKYLRLVADFDNFRKRNAKERLELIQTASKDVITSLLTVLDDTERAEKQIKSANDLEALKEGSILVFSKLRNTLQSAGLKPMESIGKEFNPEFHDAITEIPAPSGDLRGKVIDEIQKGYYLNDKIIRHAKVVVGK